MSGKVDAQGKPVVFVCQTCSKSFTRKDYLNRHEKNHTQEKPFKCSQCNLSFTRSDLLSKHFKSKSHQRVRSSITDSTGLGGGGGPGAETTSTSQMVPVNTEIRAAFTAGSSFPTGQVTVSDASFTNKLNPMAVEIPLSSTRNDALENHPPPPVHAASSSSSSSSSSRTNSGPDRKPKRFKRLGISSFLNQSINEERIPAPPPQPSIILPATPKNAGVPSTNPSSISRLIDNNGNPMQVNGGYYQAPVQEKRESYTLAPPKTSPNINQLLNNPTDPLVSPPLTESSANGIDENLFWLFNDISPLDNIFWLFNDMPSLESGLKNAPQNSNIRANSETGQPASSIYAENNNTTASDAFISGSNVSSNGIDISSAMYQNLYNESTNTNINANKISMTEVTRARILDIFPTIDQLNNISLERFEEYIDLYWFNFAQTFPVIHQATFNPNTMNIYLLISMIVIGMAHSLDKIEYQTSIAVNKKYRRVIYDIIEENTELPLPLMQALILHNFSAKNFGDTQLSKIAQIDHGANIMYLKFSGFLDNLTEPIIYLPKGATINELTEQWNSWIYYETCKRMVFFEFICDTQHVTFSKLELLSSFDIKLELPCTDEVWNCADPVKFFEEYQKQPKGLSLKLALNVTSKYNFDKEMSSQDAKNKVSENDANRSGGVTASPEDSENEKSSDSSSRKQEHLSKSLKDPSRPKSSYSNSQSIKMISKWPTFLWSLKNMMTPFKENQKEYSLDCYSMYSRYIILHGLLRICWDMRSGIVDLGIVSKKKLGEFFKKLEKAFLNWKGYFDLHVKLYEEQVKTKAGNVNGNNSPTSRLILSLNNYGPTNASWANISFYYTGLFGLYTDVHSITKFATEYKNFHPLTKTLYKGIKEMEYERNRSTIEQWARSIYGKLALIEACKFLRLVYGNEETINTFSHVPHTAYLAAVIVWCYEIKRDCPNLETINKERRGNSSIANDNKIKLDTKKYVDTLGIINFELAREDAFEYFSMILDLEDENENTDVASKFEEFKERQMNTIGVVCYILHLLRNCKWIYSIDLVHQLEHVVSTYET